jgi:colanic acid/amylovoran biosynthesis protein
MKKLVLGIVGASPVNRNLGVSALAYGLLNSYVELYKNQLTECVFIVPWERSISWSKEIKGHKIIIYISNYNLRITKGFSRNILLDFICAFIIRLIPFRIIKRIIVSKRPLLNDINRCSFIGDIYGGDSFSDIYGVLHFFKSYILRIIIMLLRKELVLLPQTYGPYSNLFTKKAAKVLISYAKLKYTRDKESVRNVDSLWQSSKKRPSVNYIPDLAFVAGYIDVEIKGFSEWLNRFNNKSKIVGVNLSGLLYYDSLNNNGKFGLIENYYEKVRTFCQKLLHNDYSIVFIPHTFKIPIECKKSGCENDMVPIMRVFNEYNNLYPGRIYIIDKNYNAAEIRYFIKHCCYFVGSRMHSCIGSLSMKVPTIALSYSDKYDGLFKSLGIYESVYDLRKNNKIDLYEFFEEWKLGCSGKKETIEHIIDGVDKIIYEGLSNSLLMNVIKE